MRLPRLLHESNIFESNMLLCKHVTLGMHGKSGCSMLCTARLDVARLLLVVQLLQQLLAKLVQDQL